MNEKFNLLLECIIEAKDDDNFKQLLQDNFDTKYLAICLSVLIGCRKLFNINLISIIRATNDLFNEVDKR